ncbi:hypothetical protein Tco_0994534, partial [Tanacetum coccineum]
RPNVHKEVKESGLESIRDVTFNQIMDEIDQKNKAAQEKPKSPYDTELEIKIIKRFQLRQPDYDAQIMFLGVEPYHFEYDQTKSTKHGDSNSNSGLCSMPDDDLLKSNISKKVTDDIQSFVPSIVADNLKANLPDLLSEALKNTLP